MGIYDRDYMRVPRPRLPRTSLPRQALPSTVRPSIGTGHDDESPFALALPLLIAVQLVVLAIPTIAFGIDDRSYTWLAEFGIQGWSGDPLEVVLILPGLSIGAFILSRLLPPRLGGLAIAAFGVLGCLWLLEATGGTAVLGNALARSLVLPAGGGAWLPMLALGFCVAGSMMNDLSPLRRAVLASAVIPAGLYLIGPLWNPLELPTWADLIDVVWNTQGATEVHTFSFYLKRSDTIVFTDWPVAYWVQWIAKLVACAAIAIFALGQIGVAAAALTGSGDEFGDTPVGAVPLVMLFGCSFFALLAQMVWVWALPWGSAANGFLLGVDAVGAALAALPFVILPFIGLGRFLAPAD